MKKASVIETVAFLMLCSCALKQPAVFDPINYQTVEFKRIWNLSSDYMKELVAVECRFGSSRPDPYDDDQLKISLRSSDASDSTGAATGLLKKSMYSEMETLEANQLIRVYGEVCKSTVVDAFTKKPFGFGLRIHKIEKLAD